MSRVTVAHVVLNLDVGGLERVVANLVADPANTEYRYVICCLQHTGEFAKPLIQSGIPVTSFSKRDGIDLGTVLRMASYFRRENVRVVHTHNMAPHLHGALAARLARVPVVIHTKHGRDYPDIPRKVRLNRWLAQLTKVIVPVSEDAARVVTDIERVPASKVQLIANGVDTQLYSPAPMQVVAPVIGTVARLSPEKDQATMIKAFAEVLSQMPDAQLVLAGAGASEDALRAQAKHLGLGDSVRFLGMRDDVPNVMRSFAIFTLTSISEGLSMTVIEAMASGLPVVATDVGGNRQLVDPPHCGLIVPRGDVAGLADAYLRLLRDADERRRMGEAARARAVAEFGVSRMAGAYRELYRRLLSAH